MAKKGRDIEFQFQISAEMEQSFKQTMGMTEKNIKEIEKELRGIKSSSSFKSVEKEMKAAGKAAGTLEQEMKGIGEIFGDVAKYAGSFALLTEGVGSLGDMATSVLHLDSSMAQMQAATGLTAAEMKEVEESARAIYTMGLGEGFVDISNKITAVKQNTKVTGEELENLTKQAMMFEDVFGEGVAESTRSADMLMKQFGLDSKQAYNLMAQGMQGGLNKTNELLDTINEFSPQFKVLGFTAEEMFNLFGTGLDAGAWNLDKVGDLVKEFDNRMKDLGDKNFRESLAGLFGDESEVMLKGLSDGSLRGADALNQIIVKLSEIEDPLQKQTYGIALMGTQYEDLGQKVVDSLATVDSRFDSTKQTMSEIEAIKYDNVLQDFKELGRELMDSFIIPLGETLLPALEDLAEWGKDNKELIKNLALLVPTVAAGKKMGQFATSLGSLGKASSGAGKGIKALGLATGLLGGPVGLGVTAIAGVTMAVDAYKKNQEEARQALLHMGDSMEEAYKNYEVVVNHTNTVSDLITEYDQLNETIKYSKAPAEELEAARTRLAEVEQLLIDLNPDILRAEDAKTDRFRKQLGAIEELNDIELKRAKRELEIQHIDNQTKINSLEEEHKKLTANLALYDEQYEKSLNQLELWAKYNDRYQEIVNNPNLSYEDHYAQLEALAREVEAATGITVLGKEAEIFNNFSKAKSDLEEYNELWKKADDDLKAANESLEQIYEVSKANIEMDLGGSIEEYAKKFGQLSEAEKTAFVEALKKIDELNKQLDLLPDSKKINVDMVYNNAAGYNNIPASVRAQYGLKGLDQYAKGGFANEASIFGEAGLEAAIPINNNPRSHAILDKVNDMMGHSTSNNTNITFAPVINISGTASQQTVAEINKAMIEERVKFEQMFNEMMRRRERISFV